MSALFGFWIQAVPDMRSMSWWLPAGTARDIVWWSVFTLNLAVLVWFLWKMLYGGTTWSVPRMLRARGEAIRVEMEHAEQAQHAAEQRLQEIETRIASLPAEIAALEKEAAAEAAHEYQRVVDEGQREAERIVLLGKQEIEAAAKLAQKELKGLAAALAVDLAAQHIRERLTPEDDEALVRAALAGMSLGRPN